MKNVVFLIVSVSLIIFPFYTSSICFGKDPLIEGRIDIETLSFFYCPGSGNPDVCP